MNIHLRILLTICLVAIALSACGMSSSETELLPEIANATPAPNAVIPTLSEPRPTESAPTRPAIVRKDVYVVGDTAEIAPFRITLNHVEVTTSHESGEPKPDHQFVLVDVTLSNTGMESRDVALLTQLVPEDQSGGKYIVDPGASLSAVLSLDGALKAGEQANDVVGYQTPTSAQGLRLVFRTATADGMNEAEQVVFDLER